MTFFTKCEHINIIMDKKEEAPIRPFIKYPGGKFKVVPFLKKRFPESAARYIEPFLGGGSIALNVDYPIYIVNDTNAALSLVWKHFQEMGMDFANLCQKLFVSENNNEDKFNKLRAEFNATKDEIRKAVLFIYLNRHCYNGLMRYNNSGGFNAPVGSYDKPYFPKEEFEKSLERVEKFKICNKDFREIFKMVKPNDLIYCDPPYLPLSQSANFSSYSDCGFGLQDQLDLAKCAAEAAENGATVVISNHYTWLSKQLYKTMHGAKIYTIDVSRTISSKITKREPVKEIVAVFKKA